MLPATSSQPTGWASNLTAPLLRRALDPAPRGNLRDRIGGVLWSQTDHDCSGADTGALSSRNPGGRARRQRTPMDLPAIVWSGGRGARTNGISSQPGGGHPFGVSSPMRTENSARFIPVVTASGPAISARIPSARHQRIRFRRCNCAIPWRNGRKWVDCWKCPRMGRFSVTARGSNVEPFGDALCAALISNVT